MVLNKLLDYQQSIMILSIKRYTDQNKRIYIWQQSKTKFDSRYRGRKRLIHPPLRNPRMMGLFGALELIEPLIEQVDAEEETGDREEEPVEEEGGGNEEGIALALHDRLLMPHVLGWGAGVLLFAGRPSFVLPVDIGEEEEAEGHDGEKRLQDAPDDSDKPATEAVDAWEGQEEQHDCLRRRRVAQHHPFQCHIGDAKP
ncbi:ubiquitin carboxyl-terminal hydrolase [Canna indica]|uniref:Ubiquitin carboxyl-terminal hydrolase n=1 Tax=Canna indica TaxID=4628 RepID=A0AAQ3KMM6_9LILI|nr:ubiquitin carboxyl-terminal hydrolase [Canna indica]